MQTFAPIKEKLNPETTARKIFGLIKDEMALVEVEYETQAASNIQVIDYLSDYLRSSGGKRVRPALLILSAYAAGVNGRNESVIRLATVMEMLHTATLVHDDIIDNASLRRNEASLNARFGNQTAVLMGDWLYMSAFEISLKERSLEILDILTRLTRKMTEGELIQLTTIGKLEISEDEYCDILKRKTAYLFSACCEIGAILGDASPMQRQAMREYGMHLGVAFQLADDLLDFTADEKTLGKAAGADLIEGKLTLPLIFLRAAEPRIHPFLREIVQSGRCPKPSYDTIMEKLRVHGILEQIHDRASIIAENARKNLEVFPQTEYRDALEEIPNYVIDRSK